MGRKKNKKKSAAIARQSAPKSDFIGFITDLAFKVGEGFAQRHRKQMEARDVVLLWLGDASEGMSKGELRSIYIAHQDSLGVVYPPDLEVFESALNQLVKEGLVALHNGPNFTTLYKMGLRYPFVTIDIEPA